MRALALSCLAVAGCAFTPNGLSSDGDAATDSAEVDGPGQEPSQLLEGDEFRIVHIDHHAVMIDPTPTLQALKELKLRDCFGWYFFGCNGAWPSVPSGRPPANARVVELIPHWKRLPLGVRGIQCQCEANVV